MDITTVAAGADFLSSYLDDGVSGYSKHYETRPRDNTYLFIILALFLFLGMVAVVMVLKQTRK